MKNLATIAMVVFLNISVNAQDFESKMDLRFGLGNSILGTGDMRTVMFENELNLKLDNYFTIGGGLAYANSNRGVFKHASFVQLNANIFISPFKNNKRNDFRIGAGPSWFTVSDIRPNYVLYDSGILNQEIYTFEKRSSLGLNAIIENTFRITEKYLMGLKIFTTPYLNGDINTGALLKFGVNI